MRRRKGIKISIFHCFFPQTHIICLSLDAPKTRRSAKFDGPLYSRSGSRGLIGSENAEAINARGERSFEREKGGWDDCEVAYRETSFSSVDIQVVLTGGSVVNEM